MKENESSYNALYVYTLRIIVHNSEKAIITMLITYFLFWNCSVSLIPFLFLSLMNQGRFVFRNIIVAFILQSK